MIYGRLLILISVLILSTELISQDCNLPESVFELFENQLKVHLGHGDRDFMSLDEVYGMEVPGEDGASLIYESEFWIGGLAPDSILELAAGYGDYFAGPVESFTGLTNSETCDYYDTFYFVTLEQSLNHLAYYNAVEDGTVDELFPDGYQAPQVFYDYPTLSPDGLKLAPFYDFNLDGNYNPDEGDCPFFYSMDGLNGTCQSCLSYTLSGDVSLIWITNDTGNFHENSNASPLGIQVLNIMYAFTGQEGILDRTIFLKKRITNLTIGSTSNVNAGLFLDVDLGNYNDDYIGCDIDRNLAYVYNGDSIDEGTESNEGFGLNPPSFGILTLKGLWEEEIFGFDTKMSGFIGIENNFGLTGEPTLGYGNYSYLRGFWQDGTPLTCGGDGYMDGETTTSYMYPGDSGQGVCEGWDEQSVGNIPGDRQLLISTGPLEMMTVGSQHCLEYAFILEYDQNNSGQSLDDLKIASDQIQELYDNCFELAYTKVEDNDDLRTIKYHVYPNPGIDFTILSGNQELKSLQVQLMDSHGQLIRTIRWSRQDLIIDISDLASGLYFIKVQENSEVIQTMKIIVD